MLTQEILIIEWNISKYQGKKEAYGVELGTCGVDDAHELANGDEWLGVLRVVGASGGAGRWRFGSDDERGKVAKAEAAPVGHEQLHCSSRRSITIVKARTAHAPPHTHTAERSTYVQRAKAGRDASGAPTAAP